MATLNDITWVRTRVGGGDNVKGSERSREVAQSCLTQNFGASWIERSHKGYPLCFATLCALQVASHALLRGWSAGVIKWRLAHERSNRGSGARDITLWGN